MVEFCTNAFNWNKGLCLSIFLYLVWGGEGSLPRFLFVILNYSGRNLQDLKRQQKAQMLLGASQAIAMPWITLNSVLNGPGVTC